MLSGDMSNGKVDPLEDFSLIWLGEFTGPDLKADVVEACIQDSI